MGCCWHRWQCRYPGFGQQGADPAEQYYDCIRLNEMRMLNAMVNTKGVKIKDKHAATPLHYAAAYGSLEAFRAILSAGPDVNAQNDFGATPLMWAITEPEKVRLLVAAGADVNAKSKMGRTALYLAAANDGSAATVRLLLDHGAKVEGRMYWWRRRSRTIWHPSACCWSAVRR